MINEGSTQLIEFQMYKNPKTYECSCVYTQLMQAFVKFYSKA